MPKPNPKILFPDFNSPSDEEEDNGVCIDDIAERQRFDLSSQAWVALRLYVDNQKLPFLDTKGAFSNFYAMCNRHYV